MTRHKRFATVLAAAATLLLSACGQDDEPTGASSPTGTVRDCGSTGERLEVAGGFERVVAMDSSSLELLLTLGVESDRIVGTGRPRPLDGYPSELRDDVAEVPELSKEYPTKEVLLGADPDLVVASGSSAFAGQSAVGSRAELAGLGLKVYQLANDCGFPNPAVDLEPAWRDYENLGELLGVEDGAKTLVSRQRTAVEEVQKALGENTRPVRVFETEAIEDSPYTLGAAGIGQALITLAGGTNIFDDLPKAFDAVNLETVVDRDPELIWLMPVAGTDEAKDADALRNHLIGLPALADVDAVAEDRFVTVPFEVGGFQSPRNDEALRALAEALHPDLFPR